MTRPTKTTLYKVSFAVESYGTVDYTSSVFVRADDVETAIHKAGIEMSTLSKVFGEEALYARGNKTADEINYGF